MADAVTATGTAWFAQVRVELLSGGYLEHNQRPGRVFLVHSTHTFGALADAIETTFGRWDQSHLHEFRLPDGVRIGMIDLEDDDVVLDEYETSLALLGGVGTRFEYEFDFGDSWLHRCTVEAPDDLDDLDFVDVPDQPIAVAGWGTLPDQYGYANPDLDGEA